MRAARRDPRAVAAGAHQRRALADASLGARAARALAYVLLVVTSTVVAALGGYTIGARADRGPGAQAAPRPEAVAAAVRRAVARQQAADRALRRRALAAAMRWQRAKFARELSAKVAAVRLADAANAARAYRRGRAAGRAAARRASAGPRRGAGPAR